MKPPFLSSHFSGFIVLFHSKRDAEEAVYHCEDKSLAEAVRGKCSARCIRRQESDVAIIQRMERELWLVPEHSSGDIELIEDDLENLVEHLYNLKLCPLMREKSVLQDHRLSLINTPTETET